MALCSRAFPEKVPGVTLNRLCASGLDAVGTAARAIKTGELDFVIAGGVESMSRAPFVQGKATEAFSRSAEIYDTTIGWRFVNPLMKKQYGVDSMPETGENVAEEFPGFREDQDKFGYRSQQRAVKGAGARLVRRRDRAGRSAGRQGGPVRSSRSTSTRARTRRSKRSPSSTPFRNPGTVTAGNASGVNDGARRSSSRRRKPRRSTASRPSRACSAWRPPPSRRASWASGRCRRPKS
jgi:3-oxoadipyl-CoA thiolase